jgi:hypothetical protein
MEEVVADVRIILEWILGKRWEVVDWMRLAGGSNKWWAVVNTVMDTRVP